MKSSRMKDNKISYVIFLLVNIAVVLSCYFYPITRDEFYYLDGFTNPFEEYYKSYFYVNPRLGQFFTNVVSRNLLLEIVFGLLLFNGFFTVVYLNVYRRFPNFRDSKDLTRFLVITAFFIFLINYFGEMFYYTPFSGNYTFTHVFYLFFVFLFTEYYVFAREEYLNKINYFLLIFLGIFIGMCNEHVPPVLLAMSFFGAVYYLVKNRKLPNMRFVVLPISIFVGYLILFFAPANSIKEKSAGKSVLDIGFDSYSVSLVKISKLFYYYNLELIIVAILVFVLSIIYEKRVLQKTHLKQQIFVNLLFAVLPLFIVAVSPLIGTRLLFFSSTLVIIVLFVILKEFNSISGFSKIATILSYSFLMLFFTASVIVTYNGKEEYELVIAEIENQKKKNNDVVLRKSFDYFTSGINVIDRKILLENGSSYIDKDSTQDTSQEKLIKNYYNLRSLKVE